MIIIIIIIFIIIIISHHSGYILRHNILLPKLLVKSLS